MYTIIHLPTNTYYSLINTKSKHKVVFFRKYDDAKYVADSLSTHNWIYESFPSDSKELYIMKPYQKKKKALENFIWVKRKPLSTKTILDLSTRNLDLMLVNDLRWDDDDSYILDSENFTLSSPLAMFISTLNNDFDVHIS
jgi:hypothetical protein